MRLFIEVVSNTGQSTKQVWHAYQCCVCAIQQEPCQKCQSTKEQANSYWSFPKVFNRFACWTQEQPRRQHGADRRSVVIWQKAPSESNILPSCYVVLYHNVGWLWAKSTRKTKFIDIDIFHSSQNQYRIRNGQNCVYRDFGSIHWKWNLPAALFARDLCADAVGDTEVVRFSWYAFKVIKSRHFLDIRYGLKFELQTSKPPLGCFNLHFLVHPHPFAFRL